MIDMKKRVSARRPFIYANNSNFKYAVWKEWCSLGGNIIGGRPLERYFKSFAYHLDLPTICQCDNEAHLCFGEGASLRFDAFPDYISHEVIPMLWDCWPAYWNTTENWFRKHKVKTAIFTSSLTADHFRKVFPQMNILHCPEGIDTIVYKDGKQLEDRIYDYLEYGRCSRAIDSSLLDERIKVLSSRNEKTGLATREQLADALSDSKVVLALTRQDNQPEIAEGIDTLTQRYWECMLSRCVIIGRAPQELIDLVGYNPVIPIKKDNFNDQILDILEHIEDYQELVDRNRKVALEMGDWKVRMKMVREWLQQQGYRV